MVAVVVVVIVVVVVVVGSSHPFSANRGNWHFGNPKNKVFPIQFLLAFPNSLLDFILLKFDSRTRNTARVTGKYLKALLWNKKLYIFMTAGRKRNYNSK